MMSPEQSIHAARLRQVMENVQPLADEAWQAVESLLRLRRFRKGEAFVEAGTRPRQLGFVCEGAFRSFYRTEEGVEYNKTFFTPDTFMVALSSVVLDKVNHIHIAALVDSTVLELDYVEFRGLFDRFHELERLTRKVIEFEWTKKETRELRLVLHDATDRYRFFQEEHPGLEQRIPQYHIASYLGVTPIQLSRIRAKGSRR